jgi:hypothetical protein
MRLDLTARAVTRLNVDPLVYLHLIAHADADVLRCRAADGARLAEFHGPIGRHSLKYMPVIASHGGEPSIAHTAILEVPIASLIGAANDTVHKGARGLPGRCRRRRRGQPGRQTVAQCFQPRRREGLCRLTHP